MNPKVIIRNENDVVKGKMASRTIIQAIEKCRL